MTTSACELYEKLVPLVMPSRELEKYQYPVRDPERPELRRVPKNSSGVREQIQGNFADFYECYRCRKRYRVDSRGFPVVRESCTYAHRLMKTLEGIYSQRSTSPSHVHRGEALLVNNSGYVETLDKPELEPDCHGVFALDCEMCYTTVGLELTRVTVVDHNCQVVYDELVKPSNPILDYNTQFSGITKSQLDAVSKRLEDVQRDLLRMFSSKTIIVGHGLAGDMAALKLFHRRFVDTVQLFPHRRGFPFKMSLQRLMRDELGISIQDDGSHDSKEDAVSALRLVRYKLGRRG